MCIRDRFDEHGFVVPPKNMVALKFREEEGSFLVGAVAALQSPHQILGFVGGMDIPLIHKFEAGFRQGALAVCPACKVLVGYAGTSADAFKNPARGKELATAQYQAGADVIFHAAGSTGLGVLSLIHICAEQLGHQICNGCGWLRRSCFPQVLDYAPPGAVTLRVMRRRHRNFPCYEMEGSISSCQSENIRDCLLYTSRCV